MQTSETTTVIEQWPIFQDGAQAVQDFARKLLRTDGILAVSMNQAYGGCLSRDVTSDGSMEYIAVKMAIFGEQGLLEMRSDGVDTYEVRCSKMRAIALSIPVKAGSVTISATVEMSHPVNKSILRLMRRGAYRVWGKPEKAHG